MHLYPVDLELWTDDLRWAQKLLKQKQYIVQETNTTEKPTENSLTLTEFETSDSTPPASLKTGRKGQLDTDLLHMSSVIKQQSNQTATLSSVPKNYVFMRD